QQVVIALFLQATQRFQRVGIQNLQECPSSTSLWSARSASIMPAHLRGAEGGHGRRPDDARPSLARLSAGSRSVADAPPPSPRLPAPCDRDDVTPGICPTIRSSEQRGVHSFAVLNEQVLQ